MDNLTKLGNWITNKTNRPFYVRKEFDIKKDITSARALVCGLGQFNFYINGQKVEDHELDPGWTNYNKLIQYVAFDVLKYLKGGKNALGAEVGNGWYIKMDENYTFKFPDFMPPNPNPYKPFGDFLVFAVMLEIKYTDGSIEAISADESFCVKEHPVIMSNVYGSETIDQSLVQSDFSRPDFDAAAWDNASVVSKEKAPAGKLTEQLQPPIKVIKSYGGVFLHNYNTREIYDFGQNMSGILELEIKGETGEVVKIYPAEKLTIDGDVDQEAKGWCEVDSCITYIIGQDNIWEKYRMKFTYFAGRYVAIEHNGAKIRNLKAHAISSAFATNGAFTCDDKRYNQIYDMIERTVEANMVSVHTDCPTIERFAWQEPNHLLAPSVFFMKDGNKLWEKFLLDMRTDQHTKEDFFYDLDGKPFYPGEGLMPSQCPCYIPNVLPVPDMGSFYDIIPWGSTCILGTYWHYEFYGEQKIIEDNYDSGMRYLEHLKTKVNTDGFLNHGIGDWGNPKNYLARENIETAFLYADTKTLAGFAKILGKEADMAELEEYANEVKKNYNEKLLVKHKKEGFWCYRAWDHQGEIFLTQAALALPLYWGLVPEDKESDVVKAFKYTLEKEGAFICGEVGLPYVMQTARKYEMNDLICNFILKEEHPSYYAFILDGETTLGEYWESNPRSHCHDMMGHIIEWYYNGIAGIIPSECGFKKVNIKPYLPKSMKEFECTYNSVSGKIYVHVKEDKQRIYVDVKLPSQILENIDISNLKCYDKEVIVSLNERIQNIKI